MAIHFHCEQCGHALQAASDQAGRHGKCKHCGHSVVVPAVSQAPQQPLHLKPPESSEPTRSPIHLLAEHERLAFQVEPAAKAEPSAIELRVADRLLDTSGPEAYEVQREPAHARASRGPPSFLLMLPSHAGGFLASRLRRLRNWLYFVSAVALTAIFLGFLFKYKLAMHFGALVILVANLGLLVVGAAYLVTLPFKEGLIRGSACLLLPPYTVYYWVTRWQKMRLPVKKTLGAFVPILLAGTAYFFYEEGPAIEAAAESKLPAVGRSIESELERVDPLRDDGAEESKSKFMKRPGSHDH